MSAASDFIDALQAGHQVRQQREQHEQQVADNKLRTLVLKHQIDSFKIDDQIRARTLAQQNLAMLHGLPQAQQPGDDVTTQAPNFPGTTDGQPLPDAQGQTTHPVTTRVTRPMAIPGVEGLGVPGMDITPQSLEQLTQQVAAARLLEPYTLNPGDKRMQGKEEIARGDERYLNVPRGGTVIGTASGETVATGQPFPVATPRPIVGPAAGRSLLDPKSLKPVYTAPPAAARPARPTDPGTVERRTEAQQWREYQSWLTTERKKQADAMKVWSANTDNLVPATRTPPPDFNPPSFATWRAQQQQRAPGGTPTEGLVRPMPNFPGMEQTYKNGQWVRTK